MGLTLCNSYTTRIWTAICFYSPDTCANADDFEMMGWWSIEPGSCALVYANDLEDLNQYWLYYAIADDGEVWDGPYRASVPDDGPFDQCYGLGVNQDSVGFDLAFRELDIGDNDDYTLTFTA